MGEPQKDMTPAQSAGVLQKDLDEEVLRRIAFNTEQNMRLEKPHLPVETIMSMETVLEQRRKVDEIATRMRVAHAIRSRVTQEDINPE